MLVDPIDWFVDPLKVAGDSLPSIIWYVLGGIPLLPVAVLGVFWPLLTFVLLAATTLALGNLLITICNAKSVRFVLATKQWPRTVVTALVLLSAIIAVTASNGLLVPALHSLVNAYVTSVSLWVMTISFVVFFVGAALWYTWVSRSLSFRTFHEVIVPSRR